MLASGSLDGTVRVWDLHSSTPRSKVLSGHSDAVWSVAFSPDGTIVASGGQDRTVRLWLAATGKPLGSPLAGRARVMSVAFSPDGKTVASGGDDSTISMWDVETGGLRKPSKDTAAPFRASHSVAMAGCWYREVTTVH
jgi:WD40 repeat protein